MNNIINLKILDILSCPYCGNDLLRIKKGFKCSYCEEEYKDSNKGQLDLRLRKTKLYPVQFKLGNRLQHKDIEFDVLKKNPTSKIELTNINIPSHLNEELISHFPKANQDDIMLDLGCGKSLHRKICEHLGFEYIGLDYNSAKAPILADAHALPFKDNCFKFVLSIAVLEHIQYPFIMMKEVYRVLKPGGVFIGTVAFLQQFHSESYYHHSHLGVFNSLEFANFNIKKIAPSAEYSVLMAQAKTLFPNLPYKISRFLVMPTYLAHRIWWKINYYFAKKVEKNLGIQGGDQSYYLSEKIRVLYHTGYFTFIAKKD